MLSMYEASSLICHHVTCRKGFSVLKIDTNHLAEVRRVHLRLFVARVASVVADQGTSETIGQYFGELTHAQ